MTQKNIYSNFTQIILIQTDEILGNSDIPSKHLKEKMIEPRIIETYQKLSLERRRTDSYNMLLLGYDQSRFGDFENYLGIVVDLDVDEFHLISKNMIQILSHMKHPQAFTQLKAI